MRTVKMLSMYPCLLLCSILLMGCGKQEKAQEQVSAIKVKELVVGNCIAQGEYNYSGTVEEENGTSLSFSMGGTIVQLKVKVGERVHRGQLIATVDPSTVRNSYDMALATRKQVEDAYQRMKQLHDKGSLPDIKWVEAQSQLSQAISAEKIAKKNLSDCNLYSPIEGVVSEKYAEAGQNAAPGMPIVKVVSTRVLNVKVSIPEGEVAKVRQRQHADILVSALDNKAYSGQVVEKGVIADPVSRSYSVKIRINNPDNQLLPGMVAKVSMGTSSAASSSESAIILPARLLQLGDDNQYFVWIDEGSKAVKRNVSCGNFTAQGVVIASGLSVGDKVICEGQQKVCNGTKVTTK